MKERITLFFVLIFVVLCNSTMFAQNVKGTPGTSGCLNGGTILAGNDAGWTSAQYQLLKAGVVVAPVNGDASQYTNNPNFTGLSSGTYTIKGRNTAAGTVYTSSIITVTDGYTTMAITTPTKRTGCVGGTIGLTTTVTGGKQPFIYSIALQATPTVSIQNSRAISSTTFNFDDLPIGNYIVSVTDACGQTVTGATSISNPTVTVNDIKPGVGLYARNGSFNDCTKPLVLVCEVPFQYVSNSTNVSTSDQALFTFKIKYQGQLYGQDLDGDGYGDLGGAGFPLSTVNARLPLVATRQGIFDDIRNNTMKLIVLDGCGNSKEFPITRPSGDIYRTNCGGSGMARIEPDYLACLPMDMTFTNISNPSDVITEKITTRLQWVTGLQAGATYHVTYKDASGYTTEVLPMLPASQNISIPATNAFGVTQSGWGTQQNPDYLEFGRALIFANPFNTGDKVDFLVTASNNPLVPVGTSGTSAPLTVNGSIYLPRIHSTDPVDYWPKGSYKVTISNSCGSASLNLTVQGYQASLSGYTTTAVCGGFNYVMNGTFDVSTAYQVIVVSGPSSVGQTRDLASNTSSLPFNGLSYGTYVFGLRIKGGTRNVYTQTVTFGAVDVIAVDKTKTGGFVCTSGAKDGILTIVASSKSAAPNNALQYAISTDGGVNYSAYQGANQFTGLATGIYYFKVKDGCGNIVTQTAQIGTASDPLASANGIFTTANLCKLSGGTIQLDVDSAGASLYVWSGPGITATNKNLKNPTVNYSDLTVGTNNYSCVVTFGAPCNVTKTANVVITANELPKLVITNPVAVCAPGKVNLTDTAIKSGSDAGLTYSYFTNSTATTALASPSAVAASGTYYIKAVNANGCEVISPVVVTINAQPDVPVASTVVQPTCALATGSFTISNYDANINYKVSPSAGVTISGSTIVASAGTYKIIAENKITGCTSAASADVVINAQPITPRAPIVGTILQPTCSVITCSFTIANYDASLIYKVTPSTGVTILGSVITAPTGIYTVTAESVAGCTSQASANVVISAQPATPSAPVIGAVTQPTCSISEGSFTITNYDPAYTYKFVPSAGVVNRAGAVTAPEGIYTITVESAAGCTSQASANVVINAQPDTPSAPVIGAVTQPTCSVSEGSFTITNYNPAYTYKFAPSAGVVNNAGTVNVPEGIYTVTAESADGCTSQSSADVVISAQPATPAVPVIGTVTQPTCSVSEGSFTITNYDPAYTYKFSPSAGVVNNAGTVTAPAGVYTVTAESADGCTSQPFVNVVISAQPATPSAPVIGAVTQPTCSVSEGSLTITNYNPAYTYKFVPSAGVVNNAGKVTAPAGIYTVTAESAAGCISQASVNVAISAQPATPSAPVIGAVTQPTCSVPEGSFTITNYNPAYTYKFTPSAGVVNNAGTVTAPAEVYTVTAESADGCISQASSDVVISAQINAPAVPTFGNVTQPVSCGTPNGSFIITNYDAGMIYTFTPSKGVSVSATGIVTAPAGIYTLTATNSVTGCVSPMSDRIEIQSVICAQDDNYSSTPIVGKTGGRTPSVLTNDTLNGVQVEISDVILTEVTAPTGLKLDIDGTIMIAPNTPAGSYDFVYRICEKQNQSNCDFAVATVIVSSALIDATDDDFSSNTISGKDGGTSPNVLTNDILDGAAVRLSDINLTGLTIPTGLTLNPDGTITVAPNTPAGSYDLTYSICQKLNPTNCDTATVRIEVGIVEGMSDLEIFNGMTPNGDGMNDELMIKGIQYYPNNTLEIYNRWGVKVYETDGYAQNGNYFKGISEGRATVDKGASLPTGTYFYVLRYSDVKGNGMEKSGYLYLSR